MTGDHKQTREEWEQEFRDLQHNLTPEDGFRNAPIISRRLARSGGFLIKGPKQLVCLAVAALLLVLGRALVGADGMSGPEGGIFFWVMNVLGYLCFAASTIIVGWFLLKD